MRPTKPEGSRSHVVERRFPREYSDSLYFSLALFICSDFLGYNAACGLGIWMAPYVKSLRAHSAVTIYRHHAMLSKQRLLEPYCIQLQQAAQPADRSSYSLQVHIIVAVIFLKHSEWNDQSTGHPPRSSVYSERCHLCEKHLDRHRDEESKVILWKIYQTKQRVKVMRNYGRRRRSCNTAEKLEQYELHFNERRDRFCFSSLPCKHTHFRLSLTYWQLRAVRCRLSLQLPPTWITPAINTIVIMPGQSINQSNSPGNVFIVQGLGSIN